MRILRKYFNMIVAMALSIATISCQKPVEETVIDSEIKLSGSRLLNLASDAGLMKVDYSVDGKASGQEVIAVSDVEWIKVLTDEEYEAALKESEGDTQTQSIDHSGDAVSHSVKLSVAENTTSAERRGKLRLSVQGAKDVTLVLAQKVNSVYRVDVNQSFTLNVTDIESASAHVEVAPTNYDSYYYFGVITADRYNRYPSQKAFLASYIQELDDYVASESKRLGHTVTYLEAGLLNKGFKSLTYNGFTALSEYYLIAFDLTLGGENSGKMAIKKFTTAATPASSTEFSITVDKNATVTVTPSLGVVGQYVVDVYSVLQWDQFTTPKAVAEEWLTWVRNSDYSFSSFAYDAPEVAVRKYYDKNVPSGSISTGDYYVFAFGTDGSKVTTGVSYLKFHFDEP